MRPTGAADRGRRRDDRRRGLFHPMRDVENKNADSVSGRRVGAPDPVDGAAPRAGAGARAAPAPAASARSLILRATILGATILGTTILGTGAPARADPDLARGEKLWGKCRACHTLEPGGRHKVGPNLHGVFGRAAAALPDYNYSDAMRRAGIVWNEETIDRFLAATQDFLPGTKMYGGLAIPRDREDLIAWLKSASSEPGKRDD